MKISTRTVVRNAIVLVQRHSKIMNYATRYTHGVGFRSPNGMLLQKYPERSKSLRAFDLTPDTSSFQGWFSLERRTYMYM